MKFTIEHSALSNALAHVQNVVERRNTNPLLSNVKITVREDGITLNATDNELEISEKIPSASVRVEEDGMITAPAHKLYEIVRKLPTGSEIEIVLNAENKQLKLTAGRSRFSLATIAGEDFPTIADGDMTHTFKMKSKDLADLIGRTSFAASTEESRFYLNGIYLHETVAKEAHVLRAVATDGHRLACAETALPDGASGMPGIIIPRKAIAELSKLLTDDEAEIEIALSTYKIRFVVGDLILTSLLIEGTYPDYERVIPVDNGKILEVDAVALTTVVDRVSSLSEKSRAVRLAIAGGVVKVSAANAEEGSAEDEIEAKYDAEPVDIGFNYVYLEDVLKQIKGGLVRIALSDSSSPTVLTDLSDPSVLFVLMPMRV